MTLEQMMTALRDLGLGRWVQPRLGVRSPHQLRLFGMPFDLDAFAYSLGRWVWPDDLKVSFKVERLAPIEFPFLNAIDSSMAQPVNLVVCCDGDPVVGVGGIIVSPGWTDPDNEVSDLDELMLIGMPDRRGRVVEWERQSLQFALEITCGFTFSEPIEIFDLLGSSSIDELWPAVLAGTDLGSDRTD